MIAEQKTQEIVEKIKQGDSKAKKQLFEKYAPSLMAVCYRYTGDKDDAQDVLMDGFIKIFESMDKYKENNLKAWMTKIMINQSLMFLRGRGRALVRQGVYLKEQEREIEIDNPQRFSQKELFEALDILPKSLRTVFNMSVIDELSHDEICKQLGIEKQSVYSALYKAKVMLRNHLIKIENRNKQAK